MERRKYLQIPGPTNIPDRILNRLSTPLINHRGAEFDSLLEKCIKGLKKILRTENDVLLFPSSGSGTLESVIVNLFSPGDTIAVASMGVFSERVASIGERHGLNVIRIEKEWKDALKAEDVKQLLNEDKENKIKAVCMPQNETATCVSNDIENIAKAMKSTEHPSLLIVDAISSLACMPLETDAWGIDVVISASQKGLMLPPGMGIVCLNDRAWDLAKESTMAKWYWDYAAVKAKMENGQFPYTPSTTLLFGLSEAIDIIEEEGLENVCDRHKTLATAVRAAIKDMGLELFAETGYESDAVTGVYLPEGIKQKELSALLSKKYNVIIGGGLQQLQGKIFRIGHLGSIHHADIYAVMCSVEAALYELGYDVELGSAAKAITEIYNK